MSDQQQIATAALKFSLKRKKIDGRAFGKLVRGSAGVGLGLRPSAPAVGRLLGVASRRGAVQLRNEDAQSPKSKKGFHTFPRWERGPGWTPGAFGTRAGQPDSRESAAPANYLA